MLFLSLRTLGDNLSSLVFISQLSSRPTCSTERRPWVDTRSLMLCPRTSEIKVTFCRLGRNVRLVLLLAWETLLPTCRPLPVSSQTRDMVLILIWSGRLGAPGKRRPLAGEAPLVNAGGGNSPRLAALWIQQFGGDRPCAPSFWS